MYRELRIQQKEEKQGRFMDFMELLFANRMDRRDEYVTYGSQEGDSTKEHLNKRGGHMYFFLRKKNTLQIPRRLAASFVVYERFGLKHTIVGTLFGNVGKLPSNEKWEFL